MTQGVLIVFGVTCLGISVMTGILVAIGKLDSAAYSGIILPIVGAVGAFWHANTAKPSDPPSSSSGVN